MGTFYTGCKVENHKDPKKVTVIPKLLVDTGSMHTWIAESRLRELGIESVKQVEFDTATGEFVTRPVGFAVLGAGEFETTDEVVFAQEGDAQCLGWRALSGMNARVDEKAKRLVDAGPVVAAASERSLCCEPPSPRPSPPGEGVAAARHGFFSGAIAVARSGFFDGADARTTGTARSAERLPTILPLLGERAGVRASVTTNLISRSTGPRITASR